MKKKIVSLLLAVSMVAVLLSGCGKKDEQQSSGTSTSTESKTDSKTDSKTETKPSASEEYWSKINKDYKIDKITMVVDGTLTATKDNRQDAFEEQWEKAVGVDLTIKQLDHSKYAETVGRLFVSGDLPDVILLSADMYAQYASTGILWDMTEAYNKAEFQSRITLPKINEMGMKNGKLYGFAPAYGNGCVTYVKKAWLDAVGMKAEDIKTFADYYKMLVAFHTEDPDGNGIKGDTYGVIAAGYIGGEAPYINYLPEFWQDAYPAIYEKDGQWIDGFNTEETKAALKRIAQGVKDGAIDPETLTATTKIAREKWFSNDQTGSAGVFTYWAGTWYQTLTDNLTKNNVDSELVQLAPIAEVGAYLNREAPVWCIIDDGDGDNSREQKIFDLFIDTMLDGSTVQTLWTYGAEDVHWSTKAETFEVKGKTYTYEEGKFHLLPSPNDPNALWKKNAIDPALVISPLTNGYYELASLAAQGNAFFTANCKDAPSSPSSETLSTSSSDIEDAKAKCISDVVVNGVDVETAMATYSKTVEKAMKKILAELNGTK